MISSPLSPAFKETGETLRLLNESLEDLEHQSKGSRAYFTYLDASSKRFEVLFEQAWKLLKVALEREGVLVPGPRKALTEAARFEWIDDLEFWGDVLEARNISVHAYETALQDSQIPIIRKFAQQTEVLLGRLQNLA